MPAEAHWRPSGAIRIAAVLTLTLPWIVFFLQQPLETSFESVKVSVLGIAGLAVLPWGILLLLGWVAKSFGRGGRPPHALSSFVLGAVLTFGSLSSLLYWHKHRWPKQPPPAQYQFGYPPPIDFQHLS